MVVVALLIVLIAVSAVALTLYVASNQVISGNLKVYVSISTLIDKYKVTLNGYGVTLRVNDYLVHPSRVMYDLKLRIYLLACDKLIKIRNIDVSSSIGQVIIDSEELSRLGVSNCSDLRLVLEPVIKDIRVATDVSGSYAGLIKYSELLYATPWIPFRITVPMSVKNGKVLFNLSATSASGIGKVHVDSDMVSSGAIHYSVWIYSNEGNHPVAKKLVLKPRSAFEMLNILNTYVFPILIAIALTTAIIVLTYFVRHS